MHRKGRNFSKFSLLSSAYAGMTNNGSKNLFACSWVIVSLAL